MSQVALNVWCWDKEESFISIHQLLKGVELITYPLSYITHKKKLSLSIVMNFNLSIILRTFSDCLNAVQVYLKKLHIVEKVHFL